MSLNVAKRELWTTIDMEAAIDIYNTEKSKPENARMSVRQISLQHNVPSETLRRRILGLTKSAAVQYHLIPRQLIPVNSYRDISYQDNSYHGQLIPQTSHTRTSHTRTSHTRTSHTRTSHTRTISQFNTKTTQKILLILT